MSKEERAVVAEGRARKAGIVISESVPETPYRPQISYNKSNGEREW